ncbi:PREDICTED: E3 ubiquitin-protein ligase RNF14-like [Poecilia mexicana]|uniref:E3 ubiquitin-protein ligase RNF14-like n=1 Tax=Poecilia formosa TaxID=48698 RepID=UPI000443B9AF|nr:PREDICTED: E3 ubiquitin-protein ligase RNF14-like [Poecilia formosa]XP_014861102.1 PREDICTED: E3 ubiquitin-protein ligase RNF14-like [Poecilia mexicana]
MCSVCSFAFCANCNKTYHGTSKCYEEPKEPHKPEETSEDLLIKPPETDEGMRALMDDYSTGSKERLHLLERRYGRQTLLHTVEKHVSDKWITVNTKPCPHCFSPIQKEGGCSILLCAHCRRRFDWNLGPF